MELSLDILADFALALAKSIREEGESPTPAL
jgi:hypothetical protein